MSNRIIIPASSWIYVADIDIDDDENMVTCYPIIGWWVSDEPREGATPLTEHGIVSSGEVHYHASTDDACLGQHVINETIERRQAWAAWRAQQKGWIQ